MILVSDAFELSKLSDHTIFITRQGITPNQAVASINEYYESNKISNLSILLNDVVKNSPGYGYGYYYGYGYNYGYGYFSKKYKDDAYYVD